MALERCPQLYYNARQWQCAVPAPSRGLQSQACLIPLCCFWSLHLQGLLPALVTRRSCVDWQPPWLCEASSAGLGSSGSPPRKPRPLAWVPHRQASYLVLLCIRHTLFRIHSRSHRHFHSLSALRSDFKSSTLPPSRMDFVFYWNFLIIASVSFLIVCLFRFSDSFWLRFFLIQLSRNLFISSRVSYLLAYSCF